ncbi:hypothetical protein C8R44DRAFT_890418 [Mycena epipterygia]|nr:hypothetical protein C8R44DRAFT_890418 [Mycena epipterygia]
MDKGESEARAASPRALPGFPPPPYIVREMEAMSVDPKFLICIPMLSPAPIPLEPVHDADLKDVAEASLALQFAAALHEDHKSDGDDDDTLDSDFEERPKPQDTHAIRPLPASRHLQGLPSPVDAPFHSAPNTRSRHCRFSVEEAQGPARH